MLKMIKNPFNHIRIANEIVRYSPFLDKTYQKALDHYDEAIKIDKDFSGSAYFGKAWLLIKGKKRIFTDNKKNENYKKEAV